jgi:hypothetical protein
LKPRRTLFSKFPFNKEEKNNLFLKEEKEKYYDNISILLDNIKFYIIKAKWILNLINENNNTASKQYKLENLINAYQALTVENNKYFKLNIMKIPTMNDIIKLFDTFGLINNRNFIGEMQNGFYQCGGNDNNTNIYETSLNNCITLFEEVVVRNIESKLESINEFHIETHAENPMKNSKKNYYQLYHIYLNTFVECKLEEEKILSILFSLSTLLYTFVDFNNERHQLLIRNLYL